jgi:hypothetical protein
MTLPRRVADALGSLLDHAAPATETADPGESGATGRRREPGTQR